MDLTDAALAALSIPARNALLDQLALDAYDEAQALAEIAAESAWLRAAEAGTYAGSLEEAEDRWLDSLTYA